MINGLIKTLLYIIYCIEYAITKLFFKENNKRPDWCQCEDCIFKMNTQDLICTGKLPKPIKHNESINTHRLCINNNETGNGIYSLLINNIDAFIFIKHFIKII